jgi:flagellar basal-body rod modification protein FlgD
MTTGLGSTGLSAAINAASAGASRTSGANSRASIASNFEAFLTLLTTQLKNQSPLDPLDTNQFTQQLVQFASVEQQLKSNETLSALLASTKASTTATAASFVGRQITADGATTRLAQGRAEWVINPARAGTATIAVQDTQGNVVFTQTKTVEAGAQGFSWNGQTSTGAPAPEGDYTITATARDASGQQVSVKTEVSGTVDAVDMSGSEPVLVIGSTRVPLSKVKSIASGS